MMFKSGHSGTDKDLQRTQLPDIRLQQYIDENKRLQIENS